MEQTNRMAIQGVLRIELRNVGSRSEGDVAILECSDGKEYQLYRSNCMPANDPFFRMYEGKRLEVIGLPDEVNEYFCVDAVLENRGRLPRKVKKQIKKTKKA